MSLANLLTSCRVLLIPVFTGLLIYRLYPWATAVFLAAGVTDILDGMAARRSGEVSRLGTFLDPMADKLLSAAAFVTLAVRGPIPVWIVVIIISRDVMISLGTLILFLSEGSIEVQPSRLGKTTTFLQFVTILGTILYLMTCRGLFLWKSALAVTAAATVLSGLQYLYRGLGARGETRQG